MKKPLALAALAAMILIGAAYPDLDKPDGDDARYAERDDRAEPRRYRPCRSRSDDNCIQLYERGVRASYARWLRDGDPGHQPVRMARTDRRGHRDHARHHHDRDHMAAAHHRDHRAHQAGRAQPRHHSRQARSQRRAAYAAALARCTHVVRRPARPARAAARAAPPRRRAAAAPAPAPAPQQRRDVGSAVRGM